MGRGDAAAADCAADDAACLSLRGAARSGAPNAGAAFCAGAELHGGTRARRGMRALSQLRADRKTTASRPVDHHERPRREAALDGSDAGGTPPTGATAVPVEIQGGAVPQLP